MSASRPDKLAPPQPGLAAVGTIAGAWLGVAALFGFQQALTEGGLTRDVALGTLLYDGLWAVATWAVLVLLRQRPEMIERGLGRRLPVHIGLGLATTLAVLSAYIAAASMLSLQAADDPADTFQSNLLSGLVTYALMVAVVVTLEQRRLAAIRRETHLTLERALSEARATLLRSQLQPHFLFNALNTVAGLIPEDPDRAERMVVKLGDFLRLSLETREAMVPLSRELAAMDAFLDVQVFRFGNRLRVDRDIDPTTLGVLVPDLILQPIVENALQHGLASKPEGGTVLIVARRAGDRLELVVADDGMGVEIGGLKEGLGIGITRQRIALLANDKSSGLDIRTSPRAGFTITLQLPWKTA